MKLTTRIKAHFVTSVCRILPMYQTSLIKFCGTNEEISPVTAFQDDKIVETRNHKIKDDHTSWQVFYDDSLTLIRFFRITGLLGMESPVVFPRKRAMMLSFGAFFIVSLRRG